MINEWDATPEGEAMREIREAIKWYDERKQSWLSVVTFIGIRALFGGWFELLHSIGRPDRRGGPLSH
jgi:hypothetical protein